ncbi:MAG: hypothetical protein EBU90_04140 [Proteobacteria bacterium]|nr:hypothetical protein [Pseudomonadota bacterium]
MGGIGGNCLGGIGGNCRGGIGGNCRGGIGGNCIGENCLVGSCIGGGSCIVDLVGGGTNDGGIEGVAGKFCSVSAITSCIIRFIISVALARILKSISDNSSNGSDCKLAA